MSDDDRVAAFDAASTVAAPRDHGEPPLPFPAEGARVGPYVLQSLLGRGGGGVVYLAEHGASRKRVALKMLATARAGLLGGIRREVQVLARLDHPRIVRIHEHGEEDGLPWYAMDLVEGTSLRRAMAAPAPLAARLAIVHRLCAPLATMHGEGVVHRDLKPENVILRGEGDPVLVDFGITALSGRGRELLELTGDVVGTVSYMAPEQSLGQPVDARADIYALGCMLYELLTGRPPFQAEQAVAILWMHQTRQPDPPSAHAQGVPPELDSLVLAMLAKRPQDRIGFADDVAAALQRVGAPPDALPRAGRPYLYRSALVAREGPMAVAVSAVAGLADGRGAVLLARGEGGIGRTRYAVEVAQRARQAGATVLMSACSPETEAIPMGALRKPLRIFADQLREEPPGPALARALKLLVPFEPALSYVEGVSEEPEPAPLPDHAARQRLLAALASLLAHAAGRAPLLLVIDDLPWADHLTLSFLDHLIQVELTDAPILVLATLGLDADRGALRALLDARRTVTVDLERLEPAALGTMVAEMLALPAPPPALARLVEAESAGNPFVAAEYLRAAVAEGLVSRDPGGRWRLREDPAGLATPLPALAELMERRLDRLPPELLRLAGVAAAIGAEVDDLVLERASGDDAPMVAASLAELVAADILESTPEGAVAFRHERWRRAVYERIPAGDRASVHGAIARAIVASPDSRARGSLGLHWEFAGDLVLASEAHIAAADEAAERWALDEASLHYRRYLRLAAPDARAVTVRTQFVHRVLVAQGQLAEAEAEAARALADAEALGVPALVARSLRTLASVAKKRGNLREAARILDLAAASARAAGDIALETGIAADAASVEDSRGRSAEALARYAEVIVRYRAMGDRRSEGMTLRNLSTCLIEQGRLREGMERGLEALAIHQELGQRAAQAAALGSLARGARLMGRPQESLAHYRAALTICREIGDRSEEGTILTNVSVLHHAAGDLPRAREACEEALRLQRSVGNRRMVAGALGTLAGLHHEGGDLAAARPLYEEALRLIREAGDRRFEGTVLGNYAELCREDGRPEEARASLHEAVAIHRETNNAEFLSYALVTLGTLERQAGRLDAASRALGEAVAVARGVGIAADLAEALRAWADVLQAMGRAEDAARAREEADLLSP